MIYFIRMYYIYKVFIWIHTIKKIIICFFFLQYTHTHVQYIISIYGQRPCYDNQRGFTYWLYKPFISDSRSKFIRFYCASNCPNVKINVYICETLTTLCNECHMSHRRRERRRRKILSLLYSFKFGILHNFFIISLFYYFFHVIS